MNNTRILEIAITHDQQGSYFSVPFDVPEGVESIAISYSYPRRPEITHALASGRFTSTPEQNIIDLGLISPDGTQVGASGSDKMDISISETQSTPGYRRCVIQPGKWEIIVGAYKVADTGVVVRYTVTLKPKQMRMYRGDLHVHTIASDGVHTVKQLGEKAKANGLDFLAITDHNQFTPSDSLPEIDGVTLIPGVEWTHYQGHANFLGVDEPYEGPFFTTNEEEAAEKFTTARERGALITINHPFEGNSSFRFDFQRLPFDCLEIWNGPMRESNLRAVGLWQQLLAGGQRVPICGGSDYHRDTPFIFLGGPTMCLYAPSRGKTDLLDALKRGHGFITFAPNGPTVEMTAGKGIIGDTVSLADTSEVMLNASGLLAGDVVKVVTQKSSEAVYTAETDGWLEYEIGVAEPGFVRVEVWRAFLSGLPMLPALITNPIYFIE